MSHIPEEQAEQVGNDTNSAPTEERAPAPDGGTALPTPVQEHLAQQLRATYQVMEDKPAFLGDTVLPPEFDRHIARLEERERTQIREKAHNLGIEAVEAALQDLTLEVAPGHSKARTVRDER